MNEAIEEKGSEKLGYTKQQLVCLFTSFQLMLIQVHHRSTDVEGKKNLGKNAVIAVEDLRGL